GDELTAMKQRVLAVEQAGAKRIEGDDSREKSAGEIVVASAEYKGLNGNPNMRHVQVTSFHKTAVINATGQNQPLVPSDRVAGILAPAVRPLHMRDLLPVIRTGSNLIEFAKENTATMQAEPQYSSPAQENVLKKE